MTQYHDLDEIITRQRAEIHRLRIQLGPRRETPLPTAIRALRYNLPPSIQPDTEESLAYHRGFTSAIAMAAKLAHGK